MHKHENTAIRLKIFSIALMFVPSFALSEDETELGLKYDQSSQTSGVRFSLDANSRLSSFTYVPGQWGEFHLRLENGGNAPKDLLCTSYFDGLENLQFGRRVWLPARSRVLLSHPVLFPSADHFPDGRADVRSLVIDNSQGTEVVINSDSGRLHHERTLLVTPTDRNTGVVAGWNPTDTMPQDVLDAVVACRVYQGLDNRLSFLAGHFLAADETRLDYIDHLVLAEDRLVNDQAALTAVRRWLHAGGRLWIMLDRTGPVLLERLIGDEFQGFAVDRVGLTSVRVDFPPSVFDPRGSIGETVEYDEPIEMSRITASGVDVWNTVNGWPAALTRSYGAGRILITTLGPRAWIKPGPPIPEETPDRSRNLMVPRSPMEDLASWILAERQPESLPPKALESFAKEFVSYNVPTWTLIVGLMCGFLFSLVVTGSVLWRWGRLEHFSWSGSLLAVIFGMSFFGIGITNRYGAPETVASVQLARAISGSDDVRTHGAIAVYRPDGGQSPIRASRGGVLRPDITGVDSTTRRMVTTDLGAYRWDGPNGLSQPAGLGMYPVAMSREFADRVDARATINAQGISGRYSTQLSGGADAVLATREGRIGVQLGADGRFTAGADDVLNVDQYLEADFVDDVQDRRRRILQSLFRNQHWRDSLSRPQLMLWLDDWEHGFGFGEGLQSQGDTLLSVPVEFSRPPEGTEIVIPSPLVSYATGRPPDGSPAAGFWDDHRHEWQERSRPSTTWLRVQVPRTFLPFQVTQVRIEINVSGLMGQIQILGVKNGSVVSLETVSNPVGTLVFEIEDSEVLAVSENGELTLGVSAGVPEKAETARADSAAVSSFNTDAPANYWKTDSLTLQVTGLAIEPVEED